MAKETEVVTISDELKATCEGKSHAELMDMVDNGELTEEQLDLLMAEDEGSKPKSKAKGKRKTAKYEGSTKILPCVECGKEVEVSKFMAAAKVYCDEHKPATSGKGSKAKYEGSTKICKCIDCGVEVEVTKFASPSSVRCADCRKIARKANNVSRTSGLYEVKDKDVLEQLEELKGDKVLAIKETLHDDVYEISAVPALLTFLESNLPIVEFIESDVSASGEESAE